MKDTDRIGMVITFWIGLFVCPIAFSAKIEHCVSNVESSSEHPLQYRTRGDRCEGVYVQRVGSLDLQLVSLTTGFVDYSSGTSDALVLSWTNVASTKIHLQALSLNPRIYYRMDALRPSGSADDRWSTHILDKLGIRKPGLGVMAWIRPRFGDDERTIYLPIRLRQEGGNEPGESNGYRMVVLPSRELEEVFLTVTRLDDRGQSVDVITPSTALGYGFYPAAQPFPVRIPFPKAAGLYQIEIGASLRGGGATSAELVIHHITN